MVHQAQVKPARAFAHHSEFTFTEVSVSELVLKLNGVRELFIMEREFAPLIIFMDENGSSPIESVSGGDRGVQRTMLELFNQLVRFETTKNAKVIMATNCLDILDQALLSPGRTDRKFEFPPPYKDACLDILQIYSRKMNLTRGIKIWRIAELMPGASVAEVKDVCSEVGICALRVKCLQVTQEDFEMAVAKFMQKYSEKKLRK